MRWKSFSRASTSVGFVAATRTISRRILLLGGTAPKSTLLRDAIAVNHVRAKRDLCRSHSSLSCLGITTLHSVPCCSVNRKSRQRVEVGAVAVFPPAAPATEASTTSRRPLLAGTPLLPPRRACLHRVEVPALRFEFHVGEVFRPVAERARLVEVCAPHLRHPVAPLEPVEFDQLGREFALRHECLNPEYEQRAVRLRH